MRDAGLKPYNFLDVRTGGLREETTRLVLARSAGHENHPSQIRRPGPGRCRKTRR